MDINQKDYKIFMKEHGKGGEYEIPAFYKLTFKQFVEAMDVIANRLGPDVLEDLGSEKLEFVRDYLLQQNDIAGVDPLSEAYLNEITIKYKEEIADFDKNQLIAWVRKLYGSNNPDELLDDLKVSDANDGRRMVIFALKQYLINHVSSTVFKSRWQDAISPWTLAATRDPFSNKLFGPARSTLPITVTVGNKTFVHEVTEDLCYGLVVSTMEEYQITMFDIDILFAPQKYKEPWTYPYYKIVYNEENYTFKTMKFLQGIATGDKWLKMDVHKSISSFVEVTKDGEVAMKF